MIKSRTENTQRNIASGLIKQMVFILFPFINRTIIIYLLGLEFQGLSGLFTSILQVLNLADLGFSTAVVFVLYKPIADNDYKVIRSIIAYLRNVYKWVGLIIFTLGVLLLPFLENLISGDYPKVINIHVLFFMYLTNTVLSYLLFAYKNSLLIALQREDYVSKTASISFLLTGILQILVLFLTKNFYLYVFIMILGTIGNNLVVNFITKKHFPNYYPHGKINKETQYMLNKQVKALFINKIGDVSRNSLDNIVLSSILGLSIVAIYGNYFMIFTALYGISLVITHAMQASVGNSIVKETVEKNKKDFNKFNFIFAWITGWWTICLFILYQPFMLVWMKDNSIMLSFINMTLFTLYFYSININNVRNIYINANGLFWECRYWYVIEAIGNLILNILLGYLFGVTGILLATIITILFFNFVARSNILFKYYFKENPIGFYQTHLFYFAITVIVGLITFFISNIFSFNGVVSIIYKLLLCIIVPNLLYLIIYKKSDNYRISRNFIIGMIKNRFQR